MNHCRMLGKDVVDDSQFCSAWIELRFFYRQNFAEEIAQIVRKDVMSDLPGSTEAEKFQNMFFSAPPWLIWFTFADITANFLGLALAGPFECHKFRSIQGGSRYLA